MSIKELVVGGVVTVVIGGTAYTVNQADVAKNLAEDTGMTQQQAEQYVSDVSEDDLVPYDELGADYVEDGQELINYSAEIDCINYEYDWETYSLSCELGKSQIAKIGRDEIALGEAFKVLGSDSANKSDISKTISLINTLISDYDLQIVTALYEPSQITEIKNTNSYNKALLQTALDSDQ